jgi:glycosyltransferase involved in cell wall biosynthesis
MTPSIVAIIPLYNGARWIDHSLQSVLAQTVPATEIIVVDDGSTDGGAGADVVRQMKKDHPQITLLHKPNGGQSAARNFAVANSKSDLIALLDQDDYWYPHHLEYLSRPFSKKPGIPIGVVFSNFDEIDKDGRVILQGHFPWLDFKPQCALGDCLTHNRFMLPSAAIISRVAYAQVGGFDERLCGWEDFDIFLRIFCAGYDHVFLPERLAQWRVYPESASRSERCDRSMMTYARKLAQMFPDDPARNVFYVRDWIAPIFMNHTKELLRAAWMEEDRAKKLRAFMTELGRYLPQRTRVRIRLRILGKRIKFSGKLSRQLAILALLNLRDAELQSRQF